MAGLPGAAMPGNPPQTASAASGSMMLHQDSCAHQWAKAQFWDLDMQDAISEIYSGVFVAQEAAKRNLPAPEDVIAQKGPSSPPWVLAA